MFRDRPLTWLFIAATICLDLVIACSEGAGIPFDDKWAYIESFLLGQSAILGAWLAIGKVHRLGRGTVFIVGVFSLMFVYNISLENLFGVKVSLWGFAEAVFPPYAFVTFVGVFFWQVVIVQLLPVARFDFKPIRFPLVELFGWTIIVALGSLLIRDANFSIFLAEPISIMPYVGSATLASLLVVLFSPTVALSIRSVLVALGFELTCLMMLHLMGVRDILMTGYASQLYIVCWLIVMRLDSASHVAKADLDQGSKCIDS